MTDKMHEVVKSLWSIDVSLFLISLCGIASTVAIVCHVVHHWEAK